MPSVVSNGVAQLHDLPLQVAHHLHHLGALWKPCGLRRLFCDLVAFEQGNYGLSRKALLPALRAMAAPEGKL